MAGYSASGIDKRESSIRLGARLLDGPLAGEFNGEFDGGESSQTNGFEHIIEFSILTDMIFWKSAEEG
jgi:hypothetical protein